MDTTNIYTFIRKVSDVILNPIIQLLFLVALLYFIWGIFLYVKGSDNEKDRATGSRHMLWGIFGMFIMISVYGIINVIIGTVGVDGETQSQINQVLER